jgi:hypothetical protein
MKNEIKTKLVLLVVSVITAFACQAQLSPINNVSLRTNLNLTSFQKFINLSTLANRWGITTIVPVSQKSTATANSNGVKYFINKGTPPVLSPSTTGTTQVQSISNDLVVCKTTPKTIASQIAGALFIGTPVNPTQSIIYPGALFEDDNVIAGNFTPLSLSRKPGSIAIDVLNTNGTVTQDVSNFNDKSVVNNAINALRTKTGNSFANTYLQQFTSAFESSSQINLSMQANMNVNLAPIIQIPVDVAAENSASLSFENSLNAATAAICQVYYTISVGGEGPKSTISGNIPSNALCVTDVAYGRTAFLTVASFSSRTEASLVMNQILSLGLDENTSLADAERNLSASAKFALSAGLVKMTITGGSVANAVAISDLQSFRNYVSQINPTVAGVQAVPIFYTLRYAADEAPALIGAVASYNDRECSRADQLKVTLNSIKATAVDDFGNEELYGTVSVGNVGKVYSGNTSFWNIGNGSPIQAGTNSNIVSAPAGVTFNLNPSTNSASSVSFTVNIKDKIMSFPDPEWVGASDQAKKDGYVQYNNPATGSTTFSVALADIKNAPNGILNQTFIVQQGSTAKVAVSFQLQLVNNTAVKP